jgi:hypothetical protein
MDPLLDEFMEMPSDCEGIIGNYYGVIFKYTLEFFVDEALQQVSAT